MGLIYMFVRIATGRGNSLVTQKANSTPNTSQMLGHIKAVYRTRPGHLDLGQQRVPKDIKVQCLEDFRVVC